MMELTSVPINVEKKSKTSSYYNQRTIANVIYYVFRFIITLIALYLASTCGEKSIISLIFALLFPYFYIAYSVFKYQGICESAQTLLYKNIHKE